MQGVINQVMKSPHEIDKDVGERLKILRIARHVSQDELGKSIGVTYQQIQKYESATNRISSSRIHQIANFFHVDVSYFFGEDISKYDPSDHSVLEFIKTADGFSLNSAFVSIKSPAVRRRVVDLIRSISER